MVAVPLGAVILAAALWLIQPSPAAAFAIAADTGVLSIEPLCGERLVWDLPPGRVIRRSGVPGLDEPKQGQKSTTLVLSAGSRARLESPAPGLLGIAVSFVESLRCSEAVGAFYDVAVDGVSLPEDRAGITYTTRPADRADAPLRAALTLSGRIVLGEAVQLGAGWESRPTGMLESGTVALRVIPWFDNDRVTLRTEQLERGSLLDTHACLGAAERSEPCPTHTAAPAIGFVRVQPEGGMAVQLYAQGAVGTQSFGGEQYVIEVPQSTAAWYSPTLNAVASVLIVMFALYNGTRAIVKDSIGWWRGKSLGAMALVVLVSASAAAEPVEIRQGDLVGAGYSFRRGASCFVVTARHVVPAPGVPITVFDKSGAKAEGSRSYDNASYDLALVSLPDKSPVACSSTWPDSAWLARTSFSGKSIFRVVRHYPNTRETIVRLQHAGGLRHLLTLAPVDRLMLRESDSGAIVELDDRLAGIVQSVDTATDRVNVLRFDTIDQLIGDRFRGTTTGPVILGAVMSRGRPYPTWVPYVQSWLTEKAGRAVLSSPPTVPGRRPVSPPARAEVCTISVDVLAWERVSVANPDYAAVELQLKACGSRNFLSQQLCQAGRNAQRTTPRTVQSHKLTINATVTPPEGAPATKLTTTTHMPPKNSSIGRTELDLYVLQAAVAPTLTELMSQAACR
jgi:hypothetical protein